jgi:hypothetical protein
MSVAIRIKKSSVQEKVFLSCSLAPQPRRRCHGLQHFNFQIPNRSQACNRCPRAVIMPPSCRRRRSKLGLGADNRSENTTPIQRATVSGYSDASQKPYMESRRGRTRTNDEGRPSGISDRCWRKFGARRKQEPSGMAGKDPLAPQTWLGESNRAEIDFGWARR